MLSVKALTVVLLGMLGLATAAFAAARGVPGMPSSGAARRPAFHGFYDDRKVTFLSTDVSDKKQAVQFRINFAPKLRNASDRVMSEMYIFMGRTAAGQLPVFASAPGEAAYSPLWHETDVRWKAGMTPTLVKSNDDVEKLVKSGQLIEKETSIILNCPIIKPTRSSLSG